MGLDTSHDCYHGSYGYFHQWRKEIAKTVGIDLSLMNGFACYKVGSPGIPWENLKPDALHVLLNHSDCGGYIEAADCAPLADRLEEILPLLPEEDDSQNWRETTQRFIDGLRLAASKGEPVEFC